MDQPGEPLRAWPLIAGTLALAAAFIAAAMLRIGPAWPGWWRLGLTCAAALVAAAACIGVVVLVRGLERRDVDPRVAAFVRTSAGAVVFAGLMATHAAACGSVLVGVAQHGLMLPLFLGMGLIAAGHTKRIGDTRHCPGCEYEFAFADRRTAPTSCPECGAAWLGRLIRGRRMRSRRLMAAGATVAAVAPLLMLAEVRGPGLARAMPTPVLLGWLAAGRLRDGQAWAELGARRPTPEQKAWLARRLIEALEARGVHIGDAARDWLETQIVAGAVPADVTDRYLGGLFTASLDAPEQVGAGVPFRVGLRGAEARGVLAYDCYVYLGGFGVDGGDAAAGRSAERLDPRLMNSGYYDERGDPVGAELVIEAPGRRRVRAELWVSVEQRGGRRISWRANGTPELPAASIWSRKVVLEQEIEVVP